MITPKDLIDMQLKFHMRNNEAISQTLHRPTLEWLIENLKSNFHSLETGYGLTTALLNMICSHHISIAPDQEGYDRLNEFFKSHNISTDSFEYYVNFSEDILPRIDFKHELDFILIDGGHGFPTPIIDWAYTHTHLKVGGFLMLDDVHLATGAIMRDFLSTSPEWEQVYFYTKTVVFKKILPTEKQNWIDQPYMLGMHEKIKSLTDNFHYKKIMDLNFAPNIKSENTEG